MLILRDQFGPHFQVASVFDIYQIRRQDTFLTDDSKQLSHSLADLSLPLTSPFRK